jgi:hypothetical protein
MNKTGRKTLREELQIMQRYSDLSVPYFKFLRDCLEGDDKTDKKWASEQLSKAFVRMIPQETDITSGGMPLILPAEIIHKNGIDTSPEPEGDSTEHPSV